MTPKTTLNREVNVTGYYFRNRNLQTFPRQIEFDNQRVTFVEAGMQYLVKKGQNFIKLFDATDGNSNYRLKYDPEQLLWTLISVGPAHRA
jgi:hypothetical protein